MPLRNELHALDVDNSPALNEKHRSYTMKRSTKIITAIALTFGIAGGAIAYGKHTWGNPETRAKHMVSYVSEELNLDAQQNQKLEAFKDQLLETGQRVRSEMKPMHGDISKLIAAETFDQTKALELLNSKTTMMNENAPEVLAAMGDFLDSLNAEQKAEIVEFIQHKRGRHGWKH